MILVINDADELNFPADLVFPGRAVSALAPFRPNYARTPPPAPSPPPPGAEEGEAGEAARVLLVFCISWPAEVED
jgi:hypothetical protein